MKLKLPIKNVSEIENRFPELYGSFTENQYKRYENAFSEYKKLFGHNGAYVCSSGGRVELLGNHTDHNGGKVLSCSISLDTLAFFLPNGSDTVKIFSEGYGEITADLKSLDDFKAGTTLSLVKGVARGVLNFGYNVGGFDAYITSTVLNGAGISSSASFEVLICEIFNFLFNEEKISSEQKSKIAHFAENVYFGKPCGLLDQSAIAFGGLKKLDFKDKNGILVENVKGNLDGYTLILINTGGSHENLTSEYASIPEEMKLVARAFGKERLIEIDEKDFYDKEKLKLLPDRAINRAIHFFEENARVEKAGTALESEDYETFLKCVGESGISSLCKLQNCYVPGSGEQPIPKALFISAKFLNGGANRVHGGGFAGTILNIVKNSDAKSFIKNAADFFGTENVIPLSVRKVGTIVL